MLSRRVVLMFVICAISYMPFAPQFVLAKETDAEMPLAGISASLQPDLFSGTLTGSIPIEVPPGRNGMQPNLVLSYASSGGNSWTGMGWKLEMGTIERQTKWGVLYSPTTQEELDGSASEGFRPGQGPHPDPAHRAAAAGDGLSQAAAQGLIMVGRRTA